MRANAEIDPDRLNLLLNGINGFGHDPVSGGYTRIGYSPEDRAVRDWLTAEMRRDGLAVRRDAVGNVFGRLGSPDGPAVLVGSHLDTVPQGGAFDGALGVAVALECVRALKAAGIVPKTAIEVVATAEEEGRFGGMLGSQAIVGQVAPGWVDDARDASGLSLAEAMRECGLDPAAVGQAARPAAEIAAFLELHVEQGPVLEQAGLPIGIVSGVSGCCVWQVTLLGEANHSGTTPMVLRRDAFAGLAQVAAEIPRIVAEHGTDQTRITIGKVALSPDEVHTIPGRADFSVVLRDTDEDVMRALAARLRGAVETAAGKHGLTSGIAERSWLAPRALDPGLRAGLHAACGDERLRWLDMPSGAGHDAQTMQALCPAALVFVPSRGGVSHSPAEWTDWDDCLAGARVMLRALRRLVEA